MVGFHVQKSELLNIEYFCPHCSLLLRDAVQLFDCGHRLCQSCADEQLDDDITCAECKVITSRDNLKLDRGFKNDIQSISITCSLCDWTGLLKQYQDHLNHAHPNPTCTYCEEKFLSVNDLDRHQVYICEQVTIYCPLKEFGCEEKILRKNLNEHHRTEQHQKALVNVILHLKSFNHSKISLQMAMDTSDSIENTTTELKEISETTDILSSGIKTINDDLQRLTTESSDFQHTINPLTQDLSTMKASVQEQNTFLDGIVINQDTLKQDLTSLKQNLIDIQSNSSDGTFIWKITNIKEKIDAAKSGTQTSIYSQPFYTSPTGYKMCLRLYPCGDGNARHSHMSLFFVLMRSEYDPILKFPFSYKVIFCLFDQTKQQNHIIDVFRPDIHSNSFQRPRSDMNIASGISKFVPLTTFQDENNPYVHDDTILIKVMVDFMDIPSTMLSYALGLNPGLTTPMQQAMLGEETVKRQQQSSITSMTNVETNQVIQTDLQKTNAFVNASMEMVDETFDS